MADQIRSHCASGTLAPRDRLPSVRQLAKDILVNQNTILRVYERLTATYGDPMQNGLLFENGGRMNAVVNSAINVFDTRGPKPMQKVGHFAASGA